MNVIRLEVGPLGTNCWVVSADTEGPAVVIDPGGDADTILGVLGDMSVTAVVLTHGHFDHLGAARTIMAATGGPLLVHTDDAEAITTPAGNGGALFGFAESAPRATKTLEDDDAIDVGALTLRVLHTPGHTPGGICLFAEDPAGGFPHLFAGDTLFAGSVGRTDFPGGDARALSRSIAEKLAPLPAETVVHPGHGPDTTIGRERQLNPFFPRA